MKNQMEIYMKRSEKHSEVIEQLKEEFGLSRLALYLDESATPENVLTEGRKLLNQIMIDYKSRPSNPPVTGVEKTNLAY